VQVPGSVDPEADEDAEAPQMHLTSSEPAWLAYVSVQVIVGLLATAMVPTHPA